MDRVLDALIGSAGSVIATAGSASPVPGEWTPGTVIGHLADVDHEVWSRRLQHMVHAQRNGEPAPHFEWWEPDGVDTTGRYEWLPLSECAVRYLHARVALVNFLRSLSEVDLQARAIHDTYGEVTVASMLERILAHDAEHRATLR